MRGDGYLYRRPGSSLWRAKYYLNGKPPRFSTGKTDERQARGVLRKRVAAASSGTASPESARRLRYGELEKGLFDDYKVNERRRTLADLPRAVAPLRAAFEGMKAVDISTARIRSYAAMRLETKAAPATVNKGAGGGADSEIAAVLAKAAEERRLDCVLVFHHNGRPIRSHYGAWRKAAKAAGLGGLMLHDFRRSAARNLVRAGVPERVAMAVTGHKTRVIFDRYHIVNETDLREADAKVGAYVRDRVADDNGHNSGTAGRKVVALPKQDGCNCGKLRMPEVGLEPTRGCPHGILSPARLPFRHSGAKWRRAS